MAEINRGRIVPLFRHNETTKQMEVSYQDDIWVPLYSTEQPLPPALPAEVVDSLPQRKKLSEMTLPIKFPREYVYISFPYQPIWNSLPSDSTLEIRFSDTITKIVITSTGDVYLQAWVYADNGYGVEQISRRIYFARNKIWESLEELVGITYHPITSVVEITGVWINEEEVTDLQDISELGIEFFMFNIDDDGESVKESVDIVVNRNRMVQHNITLQNGDFSLTPTYDIYKFVFPIFNNSLEFLQSEDIMRWFMGCLIKNKTFPFSNSYYYSTEREEWGTIVDIIYDSGLINPEQGLIYNINNLKFRVLFGVTLEEISINQFSFRNFQDEMILLTNPIEEM